MAGGWFLNGAEPVAVGVDCLCPGSPHPEGDTVWLRPELDVGGGFLVTAVMSDDESESPLMERMGRAYLTAGIQSWTFVDEAGKPVPVTPAFTSRLRWSGPVMELAMRAADLYGDQVMLPLVAAASSQRENVSSQNGLSALPTSPTSAGSSKRRKR